MTEVGITEFRASCPALLERVRKTGQSIVVTRFGRPASGTGRRDRPAPAARGPHRAATEVEQLVGLQEDRTEIEGDIVGPVFDASD